MAYEAYNKGLPALSSLFEANKRRAQETEALKMATSEKRDSEQFNFLNAATRALSAMVTGGGPSNPMAWLSAGASALGADRGKEFKPLESAISGATTGLTAKALPGGGDIAKTGVEALNVDNLGKTLPFIQSLSPKADSLAILGNIVTQKQGEAKIAREAAEEKAKQAFDIRKTILGSQYATPELLKQEYSSLSGLQGATLPPISTEQAMQPATEMFKIPEKTDIATQMAKATLEEKQTKAQQSDIEKSLQPLNSRFNAEITRLTNAGRSDMLEQLQDRVLNEFTDSPNIQQSLLKRISESQDKIDKRIQRKIELGTKLNQQEFQRIMAMSNQDIQRQALDLRRELDMQSQQNRAESREENKKIRKDMMIAKNRTSSDYNKAVEGYTAIQNAIDIYKENPGVTGIISGPGRKYGIGKAGKFAQNLSNATDIIMRVRTGAAIRAEEQSMYDKMFYPKWYNDSENRAWKLKALRDIYAETIKRLEDPTSPSESFLRIINNSKSKTQAMQSKKPVSTEESLIMKIKRIREGK